MSYKFTKKDFKKIAKALGIKEPTPEGNLVRFDVENIVAKRKVSLEVFPELLIGDTTGNLISVYSPIGLMQLHFCTNYITSEELGDVILFSESHNKISSIIISRDAGVTSYMNVDKSLLSRDPFKLSGEVLGCAIQLGLTEHILDEVK
ncbi:MAG: hypothetical protein SFU91_12045 [Chloroherpetonaceae bacterium]|nr:hypothetical protein [Chloroherpetonaceae bacterium]